MYRMKPTKILPLKVALSWLLILIMLLGTTDYWIDDTISLRIDEAFPTTALFEIEANEKTLAASTHERTSYTARLFGILPVKNVTVRRFDNVKLCPGGMAFGAKMFTDGLIVVGFSEVDCEAGSKQPAYEAGIRMHDVILKINDTNLTSAAQLSEIVEKSGGSPLDFTVRRNDAEMHYTVLPSLSISEQAYKTGMWVKDNTAGIGTVTFVDPKTGSFAGLGHGICDTETGALLPLSRGMIANVSITGVRRGPAGVPGELQGYFSSGKIGTLLGNTSAGVYGIITEFPKSVSADTAIPIALKNEIKDGAAKLYCTLDESGVCAYDVTIKKIRNASDNKCMEITVTDPVLIEKTGGIVQGMSGSPILQDGKLIGAVTHVLISDPAKGYGIFIENMLDAAG